ncbi:Gfo/Idh/MocA family protein [Bryobacter aggregatus]|uniref:Gfo/Idh/MocA family protein n=1 Tax=Bryobacter aggregatus TaxID=360054 RepID=UPI0004E1C9F0|nr:Gfo/Idh/MocA family oxidoreductase [Bryobacter aggregatus]
MASKIRWGVLGNAKIAREKVIPGMQKGELSVVTAIASREPEKVKEIAERLDIPTVYGSYEALLADPNVDAIYNPLPNDLHVPWSIRAAEAGKHVLCEKPIGLSVAEAEQLIAARDRYKVKVGEAFMAKTHPQWVRSLELVKNGDLGELRAMIGIFSYFNRDAANIRNSVEKGGGALMDIGCYPVTLSRMIFEGEPLRVASCIERDPDFGVDRLTSAILEYRQGQCVFSCGTQMAPYQRITILGTKAKIEIEIPFNAPPDKPTRLIFDGTRVEEFPICDQYTIQGDLFSEAIQKNGPVPVGLEDSLANMKAIEAIFRGGTSGKWEAVAG